MICSRCKKRPAVVFITKVEGNQSTPEGLCINCAKELGIGPVNDILRQMNITDENLEEINEQIMELMGDGEEDENEEGFEPGGAPTFPFVQKMFGNLKGQQEPAPKTKEEEPKKAPGRAPKAKSKRKALSAYCIDLTQRAREGQIDRLIGREEELYRVIQILSRRTKNNPCLIGEPGVGKTAIAEGLALKIAQGNINARLSEKEIFLLDLTALVAGTQFRGQFESRLKNLVEEVKAEGNIILVIDEVHNLVGSGDAEGSMNAANILKPALSRGEIQVIGATTFKEYRKYIEKDAALERRFQPVTIEEPSLAEAIEVLGGVKDYYETYHGVTVPDAIIVKAVQFSERYITDRFLPDKAIDLLDEACSCASLRNAAADELFLVAKKLRELTELEEGMENSSDQPDYEELAALKSDILRLQETKAELEQQSQGNVVTDQDLARVIELWTGIPAAKVKESETAKLQQLAENLRQKIIGQDEAVALVAAAVKRSRVQISPRRRPASFIFVGPTGVGKTELVKVLAAALFSTPETLIRLDMSEFMEKHSVSRIIGAPPGYIGYDEAGQLTEKVRRKPYSVLLFDEIEKAHPDVMNVLLQILDEGKVTDAQGRAVNFENTVIVMTSNAGSDRRENAMGFGKTGAQASREKAEKALKEFLRPEFISRVDETVFFDSLTEDDFKSIAVLMLNELVTALGEKGIRFTFEDAAVALLAGNAFGGVRGARDLRNLIRREVEDKLASMLVDRPEASLSQVKLAVVDGKPEILAI